MHLLSLLTPMDIGSWFGSGISAILAPLYTGVAAILTFFHWLYTPIFGRDSGITWLLAIISLTIVIRTLILPLFIKTIQSSRNMQMIQPQLMELQKKYAGNRERLAAESQKLYKEEGVNPFSSCLPILIQMPVFFALFRVLDGAANNIGRGWHLRHDHSLVDSLRSARFLGAELSGRFFPMNHFGATQIMALCLILAMTGLMFYTQMVMMRRNMSAEAMNGPFAQQQKMMLYLFPLMYGIGGVSIPIGVLIYWFTTNVWTLAQTIVQLHVAPAPNSPAYADWEERMVRRGKDPRQIEAARRAKRTKAPVAAPMPVAEAEDGTPVRVQRQTLTRNGRKLKAQPVTRTEQWSAVRSETEPTSSENQSDEVVPLATKSRPAAKQTVPSNGRQQPRRTARAVRRKS